MCGSFTICCRSLRRLENVAMPLLARGVGRAAALEKARGWLDEVGLAGRAEHRSGELSGGEQQRVSLARALVTGPKLLLADEPTGDLDGKTAEVVFGLIQQLHRQHGLTSVLVTHSLEFAGRCGRVLRLRDGRLEAIGSARRELTLQGMCGAYRDENGVWCEVNPLFRMTSRVWCLICTDLLAGESF